TSTNRLQPYYDELEEHVNNNNKESTEINIKKTSVQEYADKKKIKQDDSRLIQTHLTSVEHYVEKESYDKAEKHMKNLKQLIEKYQDNEKIDKRVADNLINHVNSLIEKWS